MKYTKQLVSGRDIDLSEYNLGIIQQPRIKDFMEDLDPLDFLQPFFLERAWRLEGILEENNIPFTFLCLSLLKAPHLEDFFMKALDILYRGKERKIVAIQEQTKILIYDNGQVCAFIDDTNFDILCEVMLYVMYQEEPKKTTQEKIDGKQEDIEAFEKFEKEYAEKQRKKNELCFEERVRQLIHLKNCFYENVENMTIWQFEDMYRTLNYMDSDDKTYMFASSGNFKMKLDEMSPWQQKTKIKRN